MLSRRAALAALAAAPMLGGLAQRRPKQELLPPVAVPLRIQENTPWTTVKAGDTDPVPFVLSLISNFMHCDPSLVKAMGAVKDTRWGLNGYRVPNVMLGGKLGLDAMPLIPYENYYDRRPVGGTFELNVFSVYQLDWDALQLTVIYDPQAKPTGYEPLEAARGQGFGFPVVKARLNGRPVSLLINTVTPGGLVLKGTDEFLGMAKAAPRRRENIGQDGAHAGFTFVAETLEIGPARIPEPIVRVAPNPILPWVGESHGRPEGWVDGFIGFDIAKRMNLFMNHPQKMLWARPGALLGDLHMDDRAGLNLYGHGIYYRIGEIDPKGPAAKAGLKDGDWITDYAGPRGLSGLPWAFTQKPGTAVEFEAERGGRKFRATVVTEERV
jgi:hypothetical protein